MGRANHMCMYVLWCDCWSLMAPVLLAMIFMTKKHSTLLTRRLVALLAVQLLPVYVKFYDYM